MNTAQVYPSAGEVIDGKYQIERMLGEGGMGAVARAMHLLRRAPVALKFMSPNVMSFPGAVERFLNEGVAASQIDSDHVVHIFDVGKLANGAPYLVMEYMEGRDLSGVLEHEGKPGLEIARSIHFTLQTLRGLQVAHDAGIIHRDMKPANCFVVNKEGEPDFVKLLDFGISKVGQSGKSASLTQTNSALGTPLYMSPEQAKSPRDVDLRSDLYSVGVILYELLTGRTPFNSESGEFTEILFKLFTQDPPPIRSFRPDLPPELAAAVHRALVREPKDRYSSAQEFGAAIAPWADQRSARVISRLANHVAGRTSQLPSASQPAAPVAAAFSKLGVGHTQSVGAASAGPPTAGMQPSVPLNQTPARHSAYPEAPGARAGSHAEAVAATQYNQPGQSGQSGQSGHGAPGQTAAVAHAPAAQQPGKQTDLGAARDTSIGTGVAVPSGKKASPMVFAIAGVLGIIIAGAAGYKLTRPAGPASNGGPASAIAQPDTPPPPLPPALPSSSAAPVVSVSPSASASTAAAVPPVGPRKGAGAGSPPAPSQPPPGGKVHLKDLHPIE